MSRTIYRNSEIIISDEPTAALAPKANMSSIACLISYFVVKPVYIFHIVCSIGVLLAIVSVFFLPQIIPVHFANGIADDFGNKVEIFLFPILLLIITLLTGKENIKYFLTHSKTFLTDIQYNLMIDGVLGIILIAEIYVIYASFV